MNSSANLSFDFELTGYGISKDEQYTLVASANLLDFPAVASVSLPGNQAVIPPSPSEENRISPSEETSASEAMASYESGASGSGNVKEAAQVLGAVKEEGKAAAAGRKVSTGRSRSSAGNTAGNTEDANAAGQGEEGSDETAALDTTENVAEPEVTLDKSADETPSVEEGATQNQVDIEENAVPLSDTVNEGGVNAGVIFAIIIAAAILTAVGVAAVRRRRQ